jgi:hypothetical protein
MLKVTLKGTIPTSVQFLKTEGGPTIEGLPPDVEEVYDEVRKCMEIKAFTAVELVCRKILMHVAAEKGAEEGKPFVHYVSFLEQAGYVAPEMRKWVDLIRQHGNVAAHELESPDEHRAGSTFMFTVGLLRLVFEMEFLAKKLTGA